MITDRVKMISKKDKEIISHLRRNAREKITTISRNINVPVTTIYDRVKAHEKKFVKKHTTLIDFSKFGMHAKAHLGIKCGREAREKVGAFLTDHPNVNSLYKVSFGSDFLAEVVFRNYNDVQNFTERLEDSFNIENIQIFNVVKELKKEEFMTKPEHFDAVE